MSEEHILQPADKVTIRKKKIIIKPKIKEVVVSEKISIELYEETISKILSITKCISFQKDDIDGRIDSAIKESPFLEEVKKQLLGYNSNWSVMISPARASCDIMVNTIRINLKLTDCKSADNSVNKPSIYYSITGLTDYPYASTWNVFRDKLIAAKKITNCKKIREKATEYHYLVKNKITGEVLLKPIFDIHTYVSNPSNDLQINWKKEFQYIDYRLEDTEYSTKVKELLSCLQTSAKAMIERTKQFAEENIEDLFSLE